MIESILQFIRNLSDLISVSNPVGLVVILGMVVLADIGFIIPFIIEPALFLITYQPKSFSIPVLLFVLMMTLGRQGGTAILYWLSRSAWDKIESLLRRFIPGFTSRLSARIEWIHTIGFKMKNGRLIAMNIPHPIPIVWRSLGNLIFL